MGLGLRPVVQSQHRLHRGRQLGRKLDGAGARAVLVAFMLVAVQLDLEGANHIRGGSFQFHGSPLGRHFAHSQVVFFGELFDFVDRVFIGAVLGREFFA